MQQNFNCDDVVKIREHADFKYNNLRAGASGEVFDIFESDRSGDVVYEVAFDGNMQLCHASDLTLVKKAEE